MTTYPVYRTVSIPSFIVNTSSLGCRHCRGFTRAMHWSVNHSHGSCHGPHSVQSGSRVYLGLYNYIKSLMLFRTHCNKVCRQADQPHIRDRTEAQRRQPQDGAPTLGVFSHPPWRGDSCIPPATPNCRSRTSHSHATTSFSTVPFVCAGCIHLRHSGHTHIASCIVAYIDTHLSLYESAVVI